MRAAVWIALDAVAEARPRSGLQCAMFLFLVLFVPFHAGFTDGPGSRIEAWRSTGGFRGSLVMFGMWPAVAASGFVVNVVFPRRLRGQCEPLLAAPPSVRSIVAGHALPVLLVSIAGPLITFPMASLGLGVLSPGGAQATGAGFLRACLVTWGAGTWMASALIHASLHARDAESILARACLRGCLPLLAFDLVLGAAGLSGAGGFVPPMLLVVLAAGIGSLLHVADGVDREELIERI